MRRMKPNKPDPDSEYLSKYIVDFNKRELDKFFHPEKFPKVVLSVSALGIIGFFFVAWLFPIQDRFFSKQYEKPPVSADQEREVQYISLSGPQSVKVGQEFKTIVSVRSDKKSGTYLGVNISFPHEYLTLMSARSLESVKGMDKEFKIKNGSMVFAYEFPKGLQTHGTYQELIILNFKAKKTGRANFVFDEIDTTLKDGQGQILPLWKNNYSVLILE